MRYNGRWISAWQQPHGNRSKYVTEGRGKTTPSWKEAFGKGTAGRLFYGKLSAAGKIRLSLTLPALNHYQLYKSGVEKNSWKLLQAVNQVSIGLLFSYCHPRGFLTGCSYCSYYCLINVVIFTGYSCASLSDGRSWTYINRARFQ